MSRPGTIGWFALHEARLAWRDWIWLITGGNRRRAWTAALGFLAFAFFMHGLSYLMLSHSGTLTGAIDAHVLVIVTGTLLLTFSLMLSQSIESVTRAFYARGDLELILTSPAAAPRLFAVRIAAMAVTTLSMVLVMGAPFINVLAWLGGPRWLCAYVVAGALSMIAVAVAVVITGGLFRAIGPRRTRFIAQIVAALTGAAFAIGAQFAAILSMGTLSVPRLSVLDRLAAGGTGIILWPARAVLGEPAALAALVAIGIVALAAAIRVFAPRYGRLALAAADVSRSTKRQNRRLSQFHTSSAAQALRRKEWTLLLRDPWLMSQTLMQLLYLLPAAFLLWRNFYGGGDVSALLVPILIVTAGQLGGGLAWLAVSGEDAPDLIASAPIPAVRVLRAKTEAVLGGIGVVFGPLVIVLAAVAPFAALVSLFGAIVAAGSATAIQYWFRTQARRSIFRRRQTSSRVATIAEALSSTGWAGTGALAATGTWIAVIPGAVVLALVAGAWMISPARSSSMN
jgi:ABC-2 type transport system permease protein